MSKNSFWRKIFFLGAIFCGALIITALSSGYEQLSAETEEVHWEYGGAYNVHQWGLLSPEFESCKIGRNQSPVNLNNLDFFPSVESAELKFNYQPSIVAVENNGHTIVVNYGKGSSVTIDDEEYELIQFHFHTPSEHTINNEAAAMEVHFVHQNNAGKIAVVGAMINSGEENRQIALIWDAMPDGNKANNNQEISLNAANLLPESKTYYSYQGSLTTPPCSEEVSWNLLVEPIEVSSEQIDTFSQIFPYNARPIQPLNGRPVKLNQE